MTRKITNKKLQSLDIKSVMPPLLIFKMNQYTYIKLTKAMLTTPDLMLIKTKILNLPLATPIHLAPSNTPCRTQALHWGQSPCRLLA